MIHDPAGYSIERPDLSPAIQPVVIVLQLCSKFPESDLRAAHSIFVSGLPGAVHDVFNSDVIYSLFDDSVALRPVQSLNITLISEGLSIYAEQQARRQPRQVLRTYRATEKGQTCKE